MNREQARGKWYQIKGMAKKVWGELTDDDFRKAEGSVDKLCGVIQEKVGDTEKAIKDKLEKLQTKFSRAEANSRRQTAIQSAMRIVLAPPFKLQGRRKCCE